MSDTNQPNTDQSSTPSEENATNQQQQQQQQQDNKKKPRTGPKRRKVTHACVYCRRSHMTCDEGKENKKKLYLNIIRSSLSTLYQTQYWSFMP
jgi:hypothetical protein